MLQYQTADSATKFFFKKRHAQNSDILLSCLLSEFIKSEKQKLLKSCFRHCNFVAPTNVLINIRYYNTFTICFTVFTEFGRWCLFSTSRQYLRNKIFCFELLLFIIVPNQFNGGGTINSTGFFVQSILGDRYIHDRRLCLSTVEYGIKRFFAFRFFSVS